MKWHIPLDLAQGAPPETGRLSALLLAHGSMQLRYYRVPRPDPQVPHAQDEVYIIVRGSGVFVNGAERCRFAPGDALFVKAGVAHGFEASADGDVEAWVLFWGPAGGE